MHLCNFWLNLSLEIFGKSLQFFLIRVMFVIIALSCLCPYLLSLVFFFRGKNGSFDFGNQSFTSFSLQVINMSKSLFESCLLIVSNLLFSGLEMLLKSFNWEVVYLLISKILYLLLHYSHNSLLLYADNIIDYDLLCGQKLLQLLVSLCCLTFSDFSFNLFTFSHLFLLLFLQKSSFS